ncbi:C2 family cysteine protease [Actinosynnema sp. ALI-1.44]|uniref:C2 family cysteine protease n=1 Tax=Actinosynnema sp. ALI-1.44 TaxID=1933779 RepID=UPI00143D0494|nr:C2 family cysteine protease [Actinosynnema sp. ALI-1.44]
MRYDRGDERVPAGESTGPAVPKAVAAITHIQRLAGNAAVGRALRPDPSQVAQLQGDDNNFGQRVAISPDLLEMLSETSAPPADRDLVPAVSDATFEQYDGHAFVQGHGDRDAVDPNDVRQGQLGDCYLCAAMIAVARAHPERIRSLIARQSNGTYNVTLHLKAGVWSREGGAQVVNVVPTFPTTGDAPAYVQQGDQAADGPELWAMLIEKAYAQVKGGYVSIADGNSGEAAAMLTGGRSTEYRVASTTPDRIAAIIDEALTNRWPVTCNSAGSAKNESAEKSEDREDYHIVAHHSYAPRSVDVSAGTVELQNPWGRGDITLLISGPFKRYFSSVDVVRP